MMTNHAPLDTENPESEPKYPLQLLILQADYGDCLLLKYTGRSLTRHILIDGGPSGTYSTHLKPELERIDQQGGKLDLVILSHVDNDHVIGLKNIFAELRKNKEKGRPPFIQIDELWHNSFAPTQAALQPYEATLENILAGQEAGESSADDLIFGIPEGYSLRQDALALGIPINKEFPTGRVTVEDTNQPNKIDDLKLWVVGPTRQNLEALKTQWEDWLQANFGEPGAVPFAPIQLDQSVTNLSSIAILAESQGRRILLTGDLQANAIMEGLQKAGLLDPQGKMQVDILKVPHHGSNRNVTQAFLENITASTYVISAKDHGRTRNPDLETLQWIAESAKKRGQPAEIILTNQTSAVMDFAARFSPTQYPYHLTFLEPGKNSLLLTAGAGNPVL